MTLPQNNYIEIFNSLKEKIRLARYNAAKSVNVELLKLYWEIGNTILIQQKDEGWGAKVIDRLAIDLKVEFPDFKGMSVRNLKYMKAFAEAYPEIQFVQQPAAQILVADNLLNTIVQTLSAQLTWSHHKLLLDKVKYLNDRLFYMQKSVENCWSHGVIEKNIA